MLYEMRSYYVVPGRLPDIIARFRDHTIGIFERIGIKNVGYWTELVGRNDLLVYIIAFEDMADREAKWEAFITDPEWIEVKTRTETDGQIVRYLKNRFLAPTDFSALQ
jgi:hypothetical protein